MSREESEGFDPFAERAQQREAEGRVDARRRFGKRIVIVAVVAVTVVVLAHGLGGTNQRSHWSAASAGLAAIRKGTETAENTDALYKLARGIEDRRGNHSALAGLYTVCALQSLADGDRRKAAVSIGVLRDGFAGERVFSKHWDSANLTVGCDACSASQAEQGLTCRACGGSGQVAGLKKKLRGGPRSGEMKTCLTCNGKGRVSDRRRAATCDACGGKGSVISDAAIADHRRKALTKARPMVLLKRVQCLLSLRSSARAETREAPAQ